MLKQICLTWVNFSLLGHTPEKSANALDNHNQLVADGDIVQTSNAPQQQPRTLDHAKSQNPRLRKQCLNSPSAPQRVSRLVADNDQSDKAAIRKTEAITFCLSKSLSLEVCLAVVKLQACHDGQIRQTSYRERHETINNTSGQNSKLS
jgi:hypothetical protein